MANFSSFSLDNISLPNVYSHLIQTKIKCRKIKLKIELKRKNAEIVLYFLLCEKEFTFAGKFSIFENQFF